MQFAQWLIYILLFLLPTQLGKHFFLPFSFINGVRIDYLSPTLYLTDLMILTLFFTKFKELKFPTFRIYFFLILILMINLIFSLSPFITAYKILKIIEAVTLFFLFQTKLKTKYILFSLNFSAALQLIITTLQMYFGKSLQGIFYFLGERYFTISTPGIAKVALHGVEILRSYGTFSHPNSLAGFYLLLYTFILLEKRFNKLGILKYIFLGISSVLIFLSFSKIAIITFLIVNAIYISKNISCKLCIVGRIIGLLVLAAIVITAKGDPDSLEKRIMLTQNAFNIILKHPLFGTGLGSYLYAQSEFPNFYSYYFLQPVHNIFLLFIAEIGIPLFLIISICKKNMF